MDKFGVGPGVRPGDPLWTQDFGAHQAAFDGPDSRYFAIAILGGGDGAGAAGALEACRRFAEGGKAYVFAAVSGAGSHAAALADTEKRLSFVRFLREADDLARACGAGPEGL
jgi:hypothetical protein